MEFPLFQDCSGRFAGFPGWVWAGSRWVSLFCLVLGNSLVVLGWFSKVIVGSAWFWSVLRWFYVLSQPFWDCSGRFCTLPEGSRNPVRSSLKISETGPRRLMWSRTAQTFSTVNSVFSLTSLNSKSKHRCVKALGSNPLRLITHNMSLLVLRLLIPLQRRFPGERWWISERRRHFHHQLTSR